MNYNFKQQVNKTNQKEAVILCCKNEIAKGKSIIDVSENPKWFKRGVDLIEISPNNIILIDVKCDERMAETGNIALELIEICSLNGAIKMGWAFSEIDYIYYVDWNNKINYKLELKKFLSHSFLKSRFSFSAFHSFQKYFTLGILIPINDINPLIYTKENLICG